MPVPVATAVPPLVLRPARSGLARLLGLHAHPGLSDRSGLWLIPCKAVHTSFLRNDIDVVFLDRRGDILRVVSRLKPWRVAACMRAHSVIELPGGYCLRHPDHRGRIRAALSNAQGVAVVALFPKTLR